MALQLSTKFLSEEALKIGLVDEVVPVDDVITTAEDKIQEWLKIPSELY